MKHDQVHAVSPALLSAAIAGLVMGQLSCADDTETTAPVEDGTEAGKVTSVTKDPSVRMAAFTQECTEAGGFVQVHAACSGNNACKGFSYNKFSFERVEHTCKGLNSCGGMSCVLNGDDDGRAAPQVYEETCADCHGIDKFTLFEAPGADLEEAKTTFAARSDDRVAKNIAFGVTRMTDGGTHMANMPAHHETLSRAQIVALVAHVRSLPLEAEEYGVVGENEEIGDLTE